MTAQVIEEVLSGVQFEMFAAKSHADNADNSAAKTLDTIHKPTGKP